MAEKKKIVCGALLTPMRRLEGVEVAVEEGIIAHVGPRDPSTDAGCRMVDSGDTLVVPGLIDLHVHGGGGHDFMDATPEAFRGAAWLHALHGTTTLLPTSLTCPEEQLMDMISAYRRSVGRSFGADLPGLHLEGPYFSPAQAGAQDPENLTPPDMAQVERILNAAQGGVARWSLAPELPGAMEMIRLIRSRGIVPSIGHSDAEDRHVAEAIENGCTHLTHLYSGMSGIVRRASYRYPGVIESAYIYPELTVEVIADGCHLPGSLLGLVYRSLGPARTALVTDALRGAGMPEGPSVIGSVKAARPCIIEDGVAKLPDRSAFAGSVATADRLVRTMVEKGGATVQDAVKMMTMTPAAIMGFRDRGRIAPGCRADLTFFDARLHAVRTMVGGRFLDETT